MLDINYVRSNPKAIKEGADRKQIECNVDGVLSLDKDARALMQQVESLRQEKNVLSKSFSKGQNIDARKRASEISQQLSELEPKLKQMQTELKNEMLWLPNPPLPEVPHGLSDADNVVVEKWGEPRQFNFPKRDHTELAKMLKLVDFERGAKVSGSRFYFLRGKGVLLQRAVVNYALDVLTSKGFESLMAPMIVKPSAMEGTGYLPHGRDGAYYLENEDKYLIGTSEVPVTSFHADEVLSKDSLPLRYAGFSSCFRSEAGSAGRDTKGLYRVHQFDKVEQVVICKNDPEESRKRHMEILENSKSILRGLKLAHRVVLVCDGDMGAPAVYKHDIETWMPSRESYSETHSCSTLHEYQSRRLNIRYKDENGKLTYAHTLNNTAVAAPRILIPIIENYQQKDGSVVVPDVLRPYMGGIEVLEPEK